MPQPSSTPSQAPPAHEGVHYDNPSSKPLDVPAGKADQAGTQRIVWRVFFLLFLCILAATVALGFVDRSP